MSKKSVKAFCVLIFFACLIISCRFVVIVEVIKPIMFCLAIGKTCDSDCSGSSGQPGGSSGAGTPQPAQELESIPKASVENTPEILSKLDGRVGSYTYEILISEGSDGSGEQLLNVKKRDGEIWEVESHTTIEATVLGITVYSYEQKATEVWKGMRLESLRSSTDDGGTIYEVDLKSQEDKLKGTVNTRPMDLPLPMTTGNCWNLSELLASNPKIGLVDAQEAKMFAFAFADLGKEKISIGEQEVECQHVRLGEKWELWLGPNGIPVRHKDEVDGRQVDFILQNLP